MLHVYGLELVLTAPVLGGSLALWAVFGLLAAISLDLSAAQTILFGLLAMALHWLSALVHHLGHAWAARRVGHPMRRIQTVFGLLFTSIYPRDEAELPAAIHIRRALGGPIFSAGLALVGGLLALLTRETGGLLAALTAFLFWWNLLVFTLAALVPVPFMETDGVTLLKWWRKRDA
jgi:hypothetical protein